MKTNFYQTPEQFTEIFSGHGVHLYESGNDYMIEVWGGSTKHPDIVKYYSDKNFNKSLYFERVNQVFNFILYVAQEMELPFSAMKLARFALEYAKEFEPDMLSASYCF